MTKQLGWWVGGAFGVGLLVGVVIGYLLFAALVGLGLAQHSTSHQAPAPAQIAPGDCPLPYPGNVIPPGCPTS